MNYLYTTIEIYPAGEEKPYAFEAVAEDSVKLDAAVRGAEGLVSLWSNMAPGDQPKVKWSGENEIADDRLEDYIRTVENREGFASSHVDRIFRELGTKGWSYISMP